MDLFTDPDEMLLASNDYKVVSNSVASSDVCRDISEQNHFITSRNDQNIRSASKLAQREINRVFQFSVSCLSDRADKQLAFHSRYIHVTTTYCSSLATCALLCSSVLSFSCQNYPAW